MKYFIIGFMGSDRVGYGRKLAEDKGFEFFDMDQEIVKADGRSILRICMMMGEHEYRNKEYELLHTYSQMDNIVVSCGDGIIHDDQCRDLLRSGTVIYLEEDKEVLWLNAKSDESLPYAFMHTGTLEERKAKFMELYQLRLGLYNQFKED